MKRVLITGITGMAGSHLADYLLANEKDCQVYGTKRWRSPMDNVEHLKGKVELLECDLKDATGCFEVMKKVRPDYVFHLAAQSFVHASWSNPYAAVNDNVLMQLNLFEGIRHAGLDPKVQVALSSEEYGHVLQHELPIKEGNPLRPLSPYAVSKVGQDMLAYQYWSSYGLKVVRTRAFNHEGPRRGEVFVTSNFAKQLAEIELGLKPPVLHVGNLNAQRDWTDVRDVVRAYWIAVNEAIPGDDYLIASGVTRTVREMLDFLLSICKVNVDVQTDPARLRPSDVEVLLGDPSKFMNATGWKPEISFEQMMTDLLNYWRQKLQKQTAVSGEQMNFAPSALPGNVASVGLVL